MSKQKISNLYKAGVLNKQKGNYAAARGLLRQVLAIDSSISDVWFELGDVNLRQGVYQNAVKCFLKVVELSPDSAAGHAHLGLSYFHMNALVRAITSYKRVLEIEPDNLSTICNIGLTYLNLGYSDKTVEYCRKAIAIDTNFQGAHLLLAKALSMLNQFEEAYISYGDARKLQPKDMSAITGMANTLIKLGEHRKAYDIISPYIDSLTNNVDLCITYASLSKEMECESNAQQYLEQLMTSQNLTTDQFIQLYFSAGELCDRTGQYDKAFKYYEAGNNRVSRAYNKEEERQTIDNVINYFKNNLNSPNNNKSESLKRPVFIVGMPRSGTSLIEQILSRHSKVFAAGELNKIPELSNKVTQLTGNAKAYPDCLDDMNHRAKNDLSEEYLECFSEATATETIITDKLPHNFMYLGFIERLFPNALIIHCKRNPIDTCLSNYFQLFSSAIAYPYKLEHIGTHYKQYQRLMNHWNSVLSLPILEVNYEDLVTDQETTTRKMIEFCNLAWEPECLSFYKSDRVVRTASYAQARKKIFTSSVEKWRNYEQQLEPLIKILNDT